MSATMWVLFTMDETLGVFLTKATAVKSMLKRSIGEVKTRRLRPGAYEYQSHGEHRTRTFYVMTEAEAKRDGWPELEKQWKPSLQ